MWSALLILAGLAGLLVGAELLVRGATALASRLGIRPIVIGLRSCRSARTVLG
jgi:cation:H+ antiporter